MAWLACWDFCVSLTGLEMHHKPKTQNRVEALFCGSLRLSLKNIPLKQNLNGLLQVYDLLLHVQYTGSHHEL